METARVSIYRRVPLLWEERTLRFALRVVTVLAGIIHTWAAISAHSMNADGISYLDIGDAYFRGDWNTAISSVWSPLYAWILGAVLFIFEPSLSWEFPVVHLVNFIIYLFALYCFEQLWQSLEQYRQKSVGQAETLPNAAWQTVGYLLFLICSLQLIELWSVTPDILLSAFVYLAAAQLVRLRQSEPNNRMYLLLGLYLSLGYLAKAIMLPVAILTSVVIMFTARTWRQRGHGVVLTLLPFVFIAGTFMIIVSGQKGQSNFAGTFTYAKHVNGIPFSHWQGEPAGSGTPQHPSRQILNDPPVYEFAAPIGGTYPIGLDPSYWYAGLEAPIMPANQANAFIRNGLFYLDVFVAQQGGLLLVTLLFYSLGSWGAWRWPQLFSSWGLAFVGLGILGVYGLIDVIGRYVGMFIILVWGDALANIRLSLPQAIARRLLAAGSLLAIIFLAANFVAFNIRGFQDLAVATASSVHIATSPPATPTAVATSLRELGVAPGDHVGVVGYGFTAFWARLARVKIVAELNDAYGDAFYGREGSAYEDVMAAFAAAGVQAVIAENVPADANMADWQQVDNTSFYIYLINHE